MSPINNRYTPREIAYQLTDSKAKFLICDSSTLASCIEALKKSPVQKLYVFTGNAPDAGGIHVTTYAELLKKGRESSEIVPSVQIHPKSQLVAIPYSSGTSELSKGVELTHYNLIANLQQISRMATFQDLEVFLTVLPLYHIYGLVVLGLGVTQLYYQFTPF